MDATAATPAFTWNGCVLLPDDVLADGVAILPDWCLVVTKFLDRSLPQEEAVAQMRSEKPNGALYVAGEIWVGAFNGDCIGYVEVK